MTDLKEVHGCAPTIFCPLMKKVGVPFTPNETPSLNSACTSLKYLLESKQELNFAESIPKSEAYFFNETASNADWFSNKVSWYSQNFPCSLAHSDAKAE